MLSTKEKKELITVSERKYTEDIENLVYSFVDCGKRVLLLSGPSGSGKTTTANRIVDKLNKMGNKTILLSMDDWFRTVDLSTIEYDEYGNPDYESPNRVDMPLFNRNLKSLLKGEETRLCRYNFKTQKSEHLANTMCISKDTRIVVEGLHSLNSAVSVGEETYRVFVSPYTCTFNGGLFRDTELRLYRRISRDSIHRGRSAEDTERYYPSVIRGEEKYLKPTIVDIDYYVNTFLAYELLVHRGNLGLYNNLSRVVETINISEIPDGSILLEFYS